MPMPLEYQRAAADFDRLLDIARESAGLATRNQAYTMIQGVFIVFRRRLELADAIRFAQVLPAVARALFVADWDLGAPLLPFEDREALTREVQALRRHHNFAPDTCIRDVARAVRACCDGADLDRILSTLSPQARAFWAG
ncbi:DUF2267 domain-containing protein [Stappia sp. 28M-7]|uniref:DUF2267 domain-containing protein n=1 Tax=Stappia sp. 28M-7 TaxID=2762596 RepID=UPI00163CB863|nr:DUF2267 domain-containing protein [Stappia sp. 28M-7]MBC2860360.1 DUF2267 domain-containing protein [Stappia sp. 28M-7]